MEFVAKDLMVTVLPKFHSHDDTEGCPSRTEEEEPEEECPRRSGEELEEECPRSSGEEPAPQDE